MKSDVLQAALCRYHAEAGLDLDEPDDHTLHLKRGDEVLVTWEWPRLPTIAEIRHTADQFV
jgi:hypothetical protein